MELRILRWSLFCGAGYFLLVAAAHLAGLKVPVLFIYFNVPSNVYQDRIISFLAFGWACFFFTAATDPIQLFALVRAIVVAGAAAVAGLCLINLTTAFSSLDTAIRPKFFWWQTAGLFLYWLWVVAFAVRVLPSKQRY